MLENTLQVQLKARDHYLDQFILTFNSLQYPITVNPDASVLLSDWLRRLRPVLSGRRDPAGEFAPSDLLRNVGTWLWQALLPESAPTQQREALAHALRTGLTPLLLALPDTLARLPWELLYDPEQSDGRGFLARRRPLIRLSSKAPAMTSIEPPLRVLLLISSPPGLGEDSRVDVESERAAVEQAVHDMREGGFLHLVVEDIVTPKRVERLLDLFKPHIVHYIGHGQYDQTNGGILLWEDDQGNELPFSTSHVASLLRSHNLHAVVLHGCETARSNARAGVLSFAGTLAQEGFPAILAQQSNLTYESSQLGSQAWYIDLFLHSIGEFLKRLGTPHFLEHTLPDPKLSAEAKMDEAVVALRTVGPVLLIIDNLESIQNEEQMIKDKGLLYLLQVLLINLHSGRVLITSRYMMKELLTQDKLKNKILHISLDDLSPYETGQLLLRYPPLAGLSEIVRQMLVREFGGLPYVYHLLSSKAAVEDLEQIIYEVREYGAVKQKTITEERKQRTDEEWQQVHAELVEFATLKVILSRLSQGSRVLLGQLGVLHQPFPPAAIEEGLKAERPAWQELLDWSLLHYNSHEKSYHLHSLTRHYTEGLLEEHNRKQVEVRLATWYEHYADLNSRNLAHYLEAHRLFRSAGSMRQAGQLVINIAKALRLFGLYPLLQDLCAITLGDMHESKELLTVDVLQELGAIAQEQWEYEQAHALYQQSLAIAEQLGDQHGRACSFGELGTIAQHLGEYEQARVLYQQSLTLSEQLGNQRGQVGALLQLGELEYQQGNFELAIRYMTQAHVLLEALQLPYHVHIQRAIAEMVTIRDFPRVAASLILQGTEKQRQPFATALVLVQQQLPPERAPLGRFLGCLVLQL